MQIVRGKRLPALIVALSGLMLLTACSGRKPVIVGSKLDGGQPLIGEIVAQHLENRLGQKVERRLGLGGAEILYQALISGDVHIYPEEIGLIESVILKEKASADPEAVLGRTRGEMLRVAQTEVIGPLGYANPPVVVVRAADAPTPPTLTAAAQGATKWRIGHTFEFQQRLDGLPALNNYRLPFGANPRTVGEKDLFTLLEKGDLNMVVTGALDGNLISNSWKELTDDAKVFPPQQGVLLARQEKLNEDPRIRQALQELNGKLTLDLIRKFNGRVVLDKQPVEQAAREFLAGVGLK